MSDAARRRVCEYAASLTVALTNGQGCVQLALEQAFACRSHTQLSRHWGDISELPEGTPVDLSALDFEMKT